MATGHHDPPLGVSGFKLYVPPFRVPLETWCGWTGASWEKVSATVGDSFRVVGPRQSLYTMAANATLGMILEYDVDPSSIGYLALGTESSGDNSAGAIIVKGLVDRALEALGRPRIARHCEVPELKHACLGGVYAIKGALRYLACDGRGKRAIVVSADIAEYERGSTGEPTQGAAAVAQLLEENPRLYTVDFDETASAAAYRGVDFRKPRKRLLHESPAVPGAVRVPEYPVFNGGYSTVCYTDQVIHAVGCLIKKMGTTPRELYREVDGWFLHRPYHRMPINVMAALYVWGLSRDPEPREELRALCEAAGADLDEMVAEAYSSPDLFRGVESRGIGQNAYPQSQKVVKHFRGTEKFAEVMARKMHLGVAAMRELGNVYTASLPAWIAAGLEEAQESGKDLAGKSFFSLGYGSGDAAEAMLIRVVPGWEEAAAKIGFARSIEGAIDLDEAQYAALHDGLPGPCPEHVHRGEFIVESVGAETGPGFQDIGIEYYRYVP
jgi:hydroxymethylglutaryl-CoA synthase